MASRFETLAIHAGQTVDGTRARALPLHRSASFVFNSAKQAADLFALKESGNIYGRLTNPTDSVLEERMAILEGGVGAVSAASGTAAIFNAIVNLARSGDEIVSASNLYGGTFTLFDAILPQFGIRARMTRVNHFDEMEAAITERTRAIYVEALGNPSLDVVDLDACAAVARRHHLPLVVDATFVTPCLLRPFEHGADIVIHSLTKWIGGHGTALGGIVIDGGSFDWTDPRFALYNEPDAGYHGLRWAHDIGGLPPYATRMRTVPLRNMGACLAPDNAWMILQGLETLSLRMARHCENALAVARFLAGHPGTAWVRYPGLPGDPAHELASRLLRNGFGGMVVFGVKSDDPRAAGQKFVESLRLFSHLANVGDVRSLALHPASTSHSQLSEEDQLAAGLPPELVRLSIGIEHIDDILADLEQALERV